MGRLFGTDGVRGIANEKLTCELAMQIGRAAASVLSRHARRRPVFVIGMDTRLSGDMLEGALCAGLCSVGADVYRLGVVPTPAVAYLVGKYKADAGVMISASHNSAEYNGIKIFSGDGFKLPDEIEEQIESIVLDGAEGIEIKTGGDVGRASFKPNAVKDYVDHLKSTIPVSLEGMSFAVDCANGSAAHTAKRLFSELGADAHILFDEPDGVNINERCGSTHLEALSAYVSENRLPLGVAFDGDADRCLCVNADGDVVDGDFIMAICARDMLRRGKLARKTVVGTIMTNLGFVKCCEANGIHFEATKVGDRYVLEEMLLENYSFGGEQSGHVIFRDFATTGDGQLTAAQLLSILKQREAKLSSLKTVMERYPQTMVNIKVSPEGKLAFHTDPKVKKAIQQATATLNGEGRVIVRPSGTEPLLRVMVEGRDLTLIEKLANDISEVIKEELV